MYEKAYYVKQNYEKANELFLKSCENNFLEGCYNLGLLYSNENYNNKNIDKAKELFKKSCENGFVASCEEYQKTN